MKCEIYNGIIVEQFWGIDVKREGSEDLESKKKILADSVYSTLGLVFMNAVLQLAVYPLWERKLGADALGDILYLISLMNVFAVSMGVSVGHARMRKSASAKTHNTPYLVILGCASLVALDVAFLISMLAGAELDLAGTILYGLLMCATMLRYYADVEYKLYLNYKKFFIYYALIGAGYIVGIPLFYLTQRWQLPLLVGELFGLGYVLFRGRIFRIDYEPFTPELDFTARLVFVLLGAEVISTFIFNADRIILRSLIGSAAVADFYVASLFGKTVALLTVPLSGVIIGYLAKYRGLLSVRTMNMITAFSGIGILLGTAACTGASHLIIPLLYPNQSDVVRVYFISANLSQVLYFAANVVTVILLRFARSKYQLYVNAAYAISFVAICIPCAVFGGLRVFCIGLALTCLVRFLFAVGLGYYTVFSKTNSVK